MAYSKDAVGRDRKHARAALFIDYEDIYRTLEQASDLRGEPDELILEMIEALQRSLLEERETQSAVASAYADFGSLTRRGDRIQRALYVTGVEPHFVPRAGRYAPVDIQLCVDAMDLLHHRPDISMFVLLTGRRLYLPLLQIARRYGRRVLVVGLDDAGALDEIPQGSSGWFFPARDLLSASSRQGHTIRPEPFPIAHELPRDGQLSDGDDPLLTRALEIIDEYFGQYEEVYLTPLLRKMSDLLDERRCDPKTIISDLEDTGAVRLEKREGFPHDYTVLIVERHHPLVVRVLGEDVAHDSYYDDHVPEDDYEEDEYEASASRMNGESDGYYDGVEDETDAFDDSDVYDDEDRQASV